MDLLSNNNYSHPSVIKACKALSIPPTDLLPKTEKDFSTHNSKLSNLFLKHYESRRVAKLKIISDYLTTKNNESNSKYSKPALPVFSTENFRSNSCNSFTRETENVERIKKNIAKKLSIEKNLKRIRLEQENKRKSLESKLAEKAVRSEKRETPERRLKLEAHDEKVNKILTKKFKDEEHREKLALNSTSFTRRTSLKVNHEAKSSKQLKVKDFSENDIDIERKLEDFNDKMFKSGERAKLALLEKSQSGSELYNKVAQVMQTKILLDAELEKKNMRKIAQISRKRIDSASRKERIIHTQQVRISRSIKLKASQFSQGHKTAEIVQNAKEKLIEDKSAQKNESLKEIKRSNEEISQRVRIVSHSRKSNQERNYERMRKQYERVRERFVEKIKDMETYKSSKPQDLTLLKSKLEEELRIEAGL